MSDAFKHLFIVGCPRSGTTWVQLLLAQHPHVATTQETHCFNHYLGVLDECWKGERVCPDRRRTGLTHLLSENEFYGLCRDFATGVLGKIAQSKAQCRVIVEKSPDHVRSAELILRLFPDAIFLHVIRDPRSVVCSLRRAGRTWGEDWAPSSTAGCAERWNRDVAIGRGIRRLTENYRELRYENLAHDTVREFREILDWLDLPIQDGFCEKVAEECTIENLQSGETSITPPWTLDAEPRGMYYRGAVDSWREELTDSDLRAVEYIVRDLMCELGYVPKRSKQGRAPLWLVLRYRLKAMARRLEPIWYPITERLNEAARRL